MDAFSAISMLDEPVRRGLYECVRRSVHPVTREEAARAQRISVKLAAFHLDKLVRCGLLRADAANPEGGHHKIGRAPKRYECANVEVAVSLPARRYDLLGEILLDVLVDAGREAPSEPPFEAALRIANERGRTCAAGDVGHPRQVSAERTVAAVEVILEELGFEPVVEPDGGLALTNCPFHALVRRAPELVCAINVAFVDGLLRGLGNETVRAVFEPAERKCCVAVRHP